MDHKHLLPEIDAWLAAQRDSYIQDLISAINIRSVAEPGEGGYTFGSGCARMLDWALEKGKELGLEAENDEYYCGSLLYKGTGEKEVCFVGHLDVVHEGTGWTFKPYDATYIDGHIVGRGAGDNKCSCIVLMYLLKYLKEHNIQLKHSIRVLYGCQEESGMTDMPHYLEKHRDRLPEVFFVCDGPFPIHHGEMGRFTGTMSADLRGTNLVCFESASRNSGIPAHAMLKLTGVTGEEARAALAEKDVTVQACEDGTVAVSAEGKSGHPAAAEQGGSVNAIAKLAAAISDSGLLDEKAAAAMAFVGDAFRDFRGTGLGLAYTDFSGSSQVHCRGANMEDGKLCLTVFSRFCIGIDQKWMYDTLEKTCAAHGFQVEIQSSSDPWFVPMDWKNGLPEKLAKIAIDVLDHPEIDLHPMILPAGTYSPTLPNSLGFGPCYSPEIIPVPKYGYAHGPDESVCVDEMLEAIRVYIVAVLQIDELLPDE